MLIPPLGAPPAPAAPVAQDRLLMEKARELETAFLAEMLGHAGLDAQGAGGFGGPGQDQFASFLREAQAHQMVEKGGIGLAELLFRSLQGARHDQG